MRAVGASGQLCVDAPGLRPSTCASAASHAPISTSRKPTPGGSSATSSTARRFAAHEVDEQAVKAFQANRPMFEGARNSIGGDEGVVEASTVRTRKGGLAVRFSVAETTLAQVPSDAHQGARNVKAVLGKQIVEVVAGDAARNAREFLPDQVGVAVAQAGQAGIDLPFAPAGADRGFELVRGWCGRRSCACRRRERCRGIQRCRRLCRRAGHGRRNCCCRSCRPACSGCAWPDRARRSGDDSRQLRAGGRERCPARRAPAWQLDRWR